MAKDPYPTSAQLDDLVLQMYRAGKGYAEAVREFKRQFVLTVLRDLNWNQSKAAQALRMHRNTLARTLRELDLDTRALREANRHSVGGVDPRKQKRLAG